MATPKARGNVARLPATAVDQEHRVTPRELFFDLVFVLGTVLSMVMPITTALVGVFSGLAVVGVMFSEGKPNATFGKIVATMPAKEGPAVKADARNRGPSRAVFQKGRAGRPARRNAVTR